MPTQRYGRDFLMLDASVPGRLLGFVYGVRLLDDADRWSHGGERRQAAADCQDAGDSGRLGTVDFR